MRKTAAVVATGFALVWAAPAGAHHGHTSCDVFGAVVSIIAQSGALGGATKAVATSEPGALADLTASEHAALCSP